jgi:hypothetical protein
VCFCVAASSALCGRTRGKKRNRSMENFEVPVELIVVLIAVVFLFFVFREFGAWFLKINRVLSLVTSNQVMLQQLTMVDNMD